MASATAVSAYTYKGWTITGREGSFTASKGGMFLGYRAHIYSMCDWIDAFSKARGQ